MKLFLALFLLFELQYSVYYGIKEVKTFVDYSQTFQQGTKYAILPLSPNNYNLTGFDNSYKETTLNEDEIKQLEELIAIAANNHNKACKRCPSNLKIKNTAHYIKQFVPALNTKGEKEVWINCLWEIGDKENYEKGIIIALDGGGYYFQVKINLTTKKVLYLGVNGVA